MRENNHHWENWHRFNDLEQVMPGARQCVSVVVVNTTLPENGTA